VGNAVAREVTGLAADDFAQRDAALKRLQGLVAEQLKQRAQIQDVINAFQADLVQQQRALAIVSYEEAQAQIAGLLEMERGLTAWTLQTMSEPVARRTELLNWGLTRENAPALARLYAENLRVRLDGVKQVAKLNDAGAQWTLGRLINDKESAVRAAAMAACWSREPNAAVVDALWFRAVSGPLAAGDSGRDGRMSFDGRPGENAVKVDFPGGDPMEFDDSNDAGDFSDAQLASDVLVHFKSPLVGDKVKALVAERIRLGKTLSLGSDPDWTLVTHRLVETYGVKEAIPLLANEALAAESDEMGGDMNGRPYMWSRRTMAIGTLCKLIKDEALYNTALSTVSNLQDTATEIKATVADARKIVDQVNSGQGTVGKLVKDETLYRETTASMTNLKEILQKVNQGQGTVGKLVNDQEFYRNAKLTLQKLDQATESLEDQGPLSVLGLAVSKLF